jgi:heme exporter protein A
MYYNVKGPFMKITINKLAKIYNSKKVFSSISWQPEPGKCNLVTGPNGSGKSTLLRLICGLEKPSAGSIKITFNNDELSVSEIRKVTGLVTPDLALYRHLTARENMLFFAKLGGSFPTEKELCEILVKVGLAGSIDYPLAVFSTGMKQRLKLAYAIFHEPALLLLDEPNTNLDDEGKIVVNSIISEYKSKSMVIIATNDQEEVRQYGENILFLDKCSKCNSN